MLAESTLICLMDFACLESSSNQASWLSGTLCLLLWLQLDRCLGSLCDLAFALEDSVLDMYVSAKVALENMEFGFSECAMRNGVLEDMVVDILEQCSKPFSGVLKEKSSICLS
ncbi:hypothetical protein K7X08_036240 [Anisodus acutangulus]|uniref:Uncharacterized protein n=1 Tax=Anisodus acutangulus TaxID=402998 RepID=A0A9Q1QUP1_9SOLA|nr:hypothetical protein K7X08_036240 [Anisodus acutangulus]